MDQKAIIYCRVSTKKQAKEGHGLESQEHRCRQYAEQHNYQVVDVFRDDFSGGGDFLNRPAMRELVDFLDEHLESNFTIIFDDLKRFARDTEFHWQLRKTLKARSATPKCLNFNFEDTPEGEFIETVIASMGELERKQNRRQVIQKQKSRLEKGYWVFHPPVGYGYVSDPIHGKLLAPIEPDATFIKKALIEYAKGTFSTMTEIQLYLQEHLNRPIRKDAPKTILSNILYTGELAFPDWEVSRRKGHHKALITLEEFEKIQSRLSEKAYNFKRQDNRDEFPLRGFVHCKQCQRPLTASWSTGRKGVKYPYYRCMTPKCLGSIKKDDLESEFAKVLAQAQPRKGLIQILEAVVQCEVEDRHKQAARGDGVLKEQVRNLEKEKKKLVLLAIDASNSTMRQAYEEKVQAIEIELNSALNKLRNKTSNEKVGTVKLKGRELLKNPAISWLNGDLENRQSIQRLVFKQPVSFGKNKRFGTAENALLYRVFSSSDVDDIDLVELVRKNWNQIDEFFDIL